MTRPEPIVLCTWKELSERFEHYSRDRWLFRGVTRSSHELIPSVGRENLRHDGLTNTVRPFKRLTENELSDFSRLWHDGCVEAIIEAQDVDRNHSTQV